SVATYRLALSRQSGASTDSLLLPLMSRALAGMPFSSGATRSSVPSQGMCGGFQQIPASPLPSGDRVGDAKKANPPDSPAAAEGEAERGGVGTAGAVKRDRDDGARDLPALMPFPHAPDLGAIRREHEVGLAQRARLQPSGRAGPPGAAGNALRQDCASCRGRV